jgi:ParB family chromosome partitioning protein
MNKPTMAVLDVDLIDVEEGFNPRKEFDPEEMEELVASIRQSGITSAPTVRPSGSRYILVAGERRLIAAKQIGLKRCQC